MTKKLSRAVAGSSGSIFWITADAVLHRLDGPAIEYADGRKQWYLNGVRYSEELTYWLAANEWKKQHG